MRIDHIAYQQAVRVSGLGLLAQLALGLTLLVYGRLAGDTAFVFASMYIFTGLPVWIGLIVVFQQHRLERLEALELDELAASRGETTGTLFEKDGARVAARRLRFMHTWLMPGISLLVAALQIGLGYAILDYFRSLADPNRDVTPFSAGDGLGWQLAISIALALGAFIFSRFVAGMSRLDAWANLRGGAGAMVGNALVLLGVGIGIVFRFFDKPAVLEGVAYGIAIFMFAVAAETILNFILNLYRPRRPGETPRPAFDSRVLSLFAAPDSIVRSINEAVNYQFGFDITSSWGYQLLLRNVGRLAGFAVVVLLILSSFAVIEPGQQALRLRFGNPVGSVYERELMVKLPWPIETAEVLDVGRVRELVLAKPPAPKTVYKAWGDEGQLDPQRNLFLVAAPVAQPELAEAMRKVSVQAGSASQDDPKVSTLAQQFALIDSDIILRWRVFDGKLNEFLTFANDTRQRRSQLDMREQALRNLALREVTQYLSTQPLDQLLSPTGPSLENNLRDRIQKSFDNVQSGVEVVSVTIPRLRPPGGEAEAGRFLEPSIAYQNARKMRENAKAEVDQAMTVLIGSRERADRAVALVRQLDEVSAKNGADSKEAIELRLQIEAVLSESQAQAAARIASARAIRWQKHMDAAQKAAEVLGEAPSFNVDPELYRQRKLMEMLATSLPAVRVKYILGLDPAKVRVNADMQEPDAGLNVYDYLQKNDQPGK